MLNSRVTTLETSFTAETTVNDYSAICNALYYIYDSVEELSSTNDYVSDYEEGTLRTALENRVAAILSNLANASTEDEYSAATTEISTLYDCLYRANEINKLLLTFESNDALTLVQTQLSDLLTRLANEPETGEDTDTDDEDDTDEDEENPTVYEQLSALYNTLYNTLYNCRIYYDSSSDYEGISDWWSTSSYAYDSEDNIIGGLYYIERYSDVTDAEVYANLSFTANSDTATCTMESLLDEEDSNYQAKVTVTDSTTGLVRYIYVMIYSY